MFSAMANPDAKFFTAERLSPSSLLNTVLPPSVDSYWQAIYWTAQVGAGPALEVPRMIRTPDRVGYPQNHDENAVHILATLLVKNIQVQAKWGIGSAYDKFTVSALAEDNQQGILRVKDDMNLAVGNYVVTVSVMDVFSHLNKLYENLTATAEITIAVVPPASLVAEAEVIIADVSLVAGYGSYGQGFVVGDYYPSFPAIGSVASGNITIKINSVDYRIANVRIRDNNPTLQSAAGSFYFALRPDRIHELDRAGFWDNKKLIVSRGGDELVFNRIWTDYNYTLAPRWAADSSDNAYVSPGENTQSRISDGGVMPAVYWTNAMADKARIIMADGEVFRVRLIQDKFVFENGYGVFDVLPPASVGYDGFTCEVNGLQYKRINGSW
ncbi:MAG: hypothetical protein ACR2PV_03005, partial [Gammaproteobacteria bacterium]